MFNLFGKQKRLYKFVYDRDSRYESDWGLTLLIVATNTADAVQTFYKTVNYNVKNIVECTEIHLDGLNGSKKELSTN